MSTRWNWLYREFSHDVTTAISVFQNNETAAMLVFQTSSVRVERSSYVKTLFVPKNLYSCRSLKSHVVSCNLVPRVIFYFPEQERERGTNRRGPWKQSWFSWCPYYRGASDIQRGTLGESWLNICKLKSDLMLTVMSLVSVRVLITPDNKCFTAVSVRTDGAELKRRKLISKYPSQVEVPIIDTGFSFITSWKLPWKRQCFENGNLEVSTFWPRK